MIRSYRGVWFVAARVIGILLALLVIAFADPMSNVGAVTSLEAAVNEATGIEREASSVLEAIAAERVVEIQTDWSHDQMQTAEILAFNGAADPVARAVEMWLVSPDHVAVMFDQRWTDIGCAMATDAGGTTWLACAFAASGIGEASVYENTQPAPPVVVLPNTAMEEGA